MVEASQRNGFTGYAGNRFSHKDQERLMGFAKRRGERTKGGVVISNHDTKLTRELYQDATELISFPVRRTISCNAQKRGYAQELLARFG